MENSLNLNRNDLLKMATFASVGAMALTPSQAAAAIDISHKIKISGDLRTFTQRMALSTAFVMLDVERDHFLEVLTEEFQEFQADIDALRAGDAKYSMAPEENKLVLEAINTVEIGWKILGPALQHVIDTGKVDDHDFEKIEHVNVQVMTLADSLIHRIMHEYKADIPQGLAYQIDVTGQLNTTSQKMIKEAVLVALEFEVEAQHEMLIGSMDLFGFGLDKMRGKMLHNEVTLPKLSPTMQQYLDDADAHWAKLKPVLVKLDQTHQMETADVVLLAKEADIMFHDFGAIKAELISAADAV